MITHHRLLITYHQLPMTNNLHRSPITHYLVTHQSHHHSPITDHPSPITHHRSPITDHQSPITHHRSHHRPSPITHQRLSATRYSHYSCCACIAVIITVLKISSTVQPRLRSLIGLLRPCNIGPMANAPVSLCTAL